MSMKALAPYYKVTNMLPPIANAANKTSTAVDFASAISNDIIVVPGLWTDGVHTLSLQYSGDNTTFTTAAAGDIIGSFTPITSTATALAQSVSYIGQYRYVRVLNTVTAATTGAVIGVMGLTGTHVLPAV